MSQRLDALANWARLRKAAEAERLLLLTDFDGTLAPIVRDASRADISSTTRRLLRALSRYPGVRAGVVSGRALSWLRQRVNVAGLIYVGNHGMEIEGPGLRFVHPLARRHTASLLRLARELRLALGEISGAWVEAKRLTLSIHWRAVLPRDVPAFHRLTRQVLAPWVLSRKIRLTTGKRVLEIRPPIDWDKGKAVAWLIARHRGLAWYLGDDRTDEDAFRAVNRLRGVSIVVGPRAAPTAAQWRLRSPYEVALLLNRLLRARWDLNKTTR